MDVSVDSDILKQLYTKEVTSLHSISDGLSACGVGRIVNPPQIIVVGEQSAGKSSVLEAISHIRFPVDSTPCTRFATELILNHGSETRINASVRFADKTKPAKALQRNKFHEDDLPDIIKEAKEHMGISEDEKDVSKDILRIEIEGPNIYPLTLVDLPGLHHKTTDDQSSNGQEAVEKLVESYMQQPNSIILVVVAANVNLADHVALEKAKVIDPQRQRTIAVITKPDLALAENAREHIMAAKNRESAHKLQLGWHVLRNRAEDEVSLETRDEIEKSLFEKHPWATIPKEDLGIGSFRTKLSGILFNHIRNNLPGVIGDIETKLRDRQKELTLLGSARKDAKEWRSYMLTIASEFQRLARDGCNGRYTDPFFGSLEDESLKFRALLRNLNRVFDHTLITRGATQTILFSEEKSNDDGLPDYLEKFLEDHPYDFPEPEEITIQEMSITLEDKAATNQGREFPGSPNVDLAMQLFKNQTAPWKSIAEFHVDTVISIARAFVDELVKHVVGSPQNNYTTEAILATIVDPWFEEKEDLLHKKIEELLWPYLTGHSSHVDMQFYRALSQRSIKAMAPNQSSRTKEFDTDRIIDMMLTYYEMSRHTFTDNVINLAIEMCLVHNIPDILTPKEVDNLTEEQLEDLAKERPEAASRRHLLETEISNLEDGLKTCRKYRPRAFTAPKPASKIATSAKVTSKPLPKATKPTPEVVSWKYKPIATADDKASLIQPSANKNSTVGGVGSGIFASALAKPVPQQTSTSVAPSDAPAKKSGGQTTFFSTQAGGIIASNVQNAPQQQQSLPATGTGLFGSQGTVAQQQFGTGLLGSQGQLAAGKWTQRDGTGISIFQSQGTVAQQQTGTGLFGNQGTVAQPQSSSGTETSVSTGPSVSNPVVGGPSVTKNLLPSNAMFNAARAPNQPKSCWTELETKNFASGPPYLDLYTEFEGQTIRYLHICAQEDYRNRSPEEIRYSIYRMKS